MAQLQRYLLGNDYPNKTFFIDTNVLSELYNFYYLGHCSNKSLTDEIICLIIDCKTKGYGLCYEDAIQEASYDYGRNLLNSSKLNAYMIAIDELIQNFNVMEVFNHKGALKPITEPSSGLAPNYSITAINLLHPWECDGIGCDKIFLMSYFCILKINELFRTSELPITKVEKLFQSMKDDLNCIMGYEFQLGQMLFIGNDKAKSNAQGILKIENNHNIKKIINSLWDITSYRRAKRTAQMIEQAKDEIEPQQLIYVTYDKALQNYIEAIDTRDFFVDKKMLVNYLFVEDMISKRYQEEFEKLYSDILLPEMESRSFELILNPWTVNMDSIKEKIVKMERYLNILKVS